MKTIFVPYIGAFGGVERLILSLSEFLHHHCLEHRVVCFHDTINLAAYAGWPLIVEQLHPERNSWTEAKTLRRFARRLKTSDLLLFDLKGAFYASLANLRDFNLHLTDPPSLLDVESSRSAAIYRRWSKDSRSVKWKGRVLGEAVQWINRRGTRRARMVITMTTRIASELNALYGVVPTVVPPGVRKVVPNPQVNRDPLTMLSVSRLEKSKRIDVAIDALATLLSGSAAESSFLKQGWRLEIVGTGPVQDLLKSYADERGVGSSVHFLGRLSDSELEAAYQRASLFVMPAIQGYGLPALEALMRELPVVLHRDSGVSEILNNSPWAEIIDHTDQLASAVNRLIERIYDRRLNVSNKPSVPTNFEWAESIASLCNWIKLDSKL